MSLAPSRRFSRKTSFTHERCAPSLAASRFGSLVPLAFLLAFLACVVLESVPAFDRFFQSPFFTDGAWLLQPEFHKAYGALLYTGPKVLIGVIGGLSLLVFAFARRSVRAKGGVSPWERPALLVLASVIIVPLLAAALKAVTGVYGPVDLAPYGGGQPHLGFLGHLLTYGAPAGGRSFPAGHASGGFALVALYYLPLRPGRRRALLLLGCARGWGMGLYQMARGEHFMSHTLTSMFMALAVVRWLAGRLRLF